MLQSQSASTIIVINVGHVWLFGRPGHWAPVGFGYLELMVGVFHWFSDLECQSVQPEMMLHEQMLLKHLQFQCVFPDDEPCVGLRL